MEKARKSVGAIDALANGFDIVRRRPWLPTVPVLVQLLLWLGPRISVTPLLNQLAEYINSSQTGSASLSALAQAQSTLLSQWANGFNLLSLISSSLMGTASFIATFIGGRIGGQTLFSGQIPISGSTPSMVISDPFTAIALAAAFVVAGLLICALFLGMVAQAVRGEKFVLSRLAVRAGRSWVRLILLTTLVPVALIVFGAPMLLIVGFLALFSLQGAYFLVSVGAWFVMILGLWIAIYLYFTVDAIILDDLPVFQAIWRSFNVVRRGFGATAFLILLVALLGAGMSVVWQQISGNVVGAVVSVIGSSYVAAGIVAASLFFYQQRRTDWLHVLDEIRARLQKAGVDRPASDLKA